MNFTRGKRIALEVLGPPAMSAIIATTVFAAFAIVEAVEKEGTWHRLKQVAGVALAAVIGAYVLAGVQSILYAFVMEWRFTRGLDPRSWRSVGWSTGLGFGAGGVIVLVVGWSNGFGEVFAWLSFGGLGLLVGFALGLLIRCLARRSRARL